MAFMSKLISLHQNETYQVHHRPLHFQLATRRTDKLQHFNQIYLLEKPDWQAAQTV